MMHRRKVFWLAILVFLLAAPAFGAPANTVKVGIYQNKPKVFLNAKGQPQGFFIDLIEHIARQEGWQLEYRPASWETNLQRLKDDQIDLLLDVAESEHRELFFDFNREIVFSNWATIYTAQDAPIQSIVDLNNRTLAAMKGDFSYTQFRSVLERLDIRCDFIEVDGFAQVFELVDQQVADAGIISRLYGLQFEGKYNARRSTIICCPANLFFAVPKGSNGELIDALDRHLANLKHDPQSLYYRSLAQWIEGVSPWRPPPWLAWLLAGLLGLTGLCGGAAVLLQRQVKHRTRELSQSNAKLHLVQADLVARNKALQTINHLADTLYRSLDYQSVIEQATDAMMTYSRSPLVGIFAYDEPGAGFKLLHAQGFSPELMQRFQQIPNRQGLNSLALEQRQVIVSEAIAEDDRIPPDLRQAAASEGFHSVLAVPLLSPERVMGVMNLVFTQSYAAGDAETQTLLGIGQTIGLAMANAEHLARLKAEINERQQAEAERSDLQLQLAQAQKMEAVGTLASGIAHDFNNLLSPIIGYSQLAMRKPDDQRALGNYLMGILRSARKARELVQAILTFSRQQPQQRKPVKMQALIRESLKLLRAALPATIQLHQTIDDHAPLVMADPLHIHQIIMNLVTNASHAIRDGEGRIDVVLAQIDIVPANDLDLAPGRYVRLTVADNGQGIAPEVQQRLFDPYFTTKPEGQGTGLGLSLVHGIVNSYQGAIEVTSTPDEGSTFDIYLPCAPAAAETGAAPVPSEPLPGGTERVLLVDDDQAVLLAHKYLLEDLGYRVVECTGAAEAQRLFKKRPLDFDLIITDLTMPGGTGETLAREIKQLRSDLPIILCTGFLQEVPENVEQTFGADRVLLKPLLQEELAAAIREVLDAG